jgi:hypothetical protein
VNIKTNKNEILFLFLFRKEKMGSKEGRRGIKVNDN